MGLAGLVGLAGSAPVSFPLKYGVQLGLERVSFFCFKGLSGNLPSPPPQKKGIRAYSSSLFWLLSEIPSTLKKLLVNTPKANRHTGSYTLNLGCSPLY